jgi:hypothetical protein
MLTLKRGYAQPFAGKLQSELLLTFVLLVVTIIRLQGRDAPGPSVETVADCSGR